MKKIKKVEGYGFVPRDKFEDKLPKDWWRHLFNEWYLLTDGDVVEDASITGKEVDIYWDIAGIGVDTKLLDVCCGQGRHLKELQERGLSKLYGVDYSEYLIELGEERTKACLRRSDARRLPYNRQSFDLVTNLGNSFGYFDDGSEGDIRVLKEMHRVLRKDGKIILSLPDGEFLRNHYSSSGLERINEKYAVKRERVLSRDGRKIISREIIMNSDGKVLVDQFYSETLYDKREMKELISAAGFQDVIFHENFLPDSSRDEDLGMMENQMVVKATA